PQGTAAYEKRGIAVDVPEWDPQSCIQCNFCSFVCPHACIRPFAVTDEELKNAPEGTKSAAMTGMPGYNLVMGVSALDCTGCGSCVNVCPGKKGVKALTMKPLDTQLEAQKTFAFGIELDEKPEVIEKFKMDTPKGSQFKTPLLEFSGACAGCGETPYAKLATQLFGERMYISNATGCSSIWGGSAPSSPYTVNKSGFGPAWANSLFEDNAEYGYGMYLAQKAIRNRMIKKIEAICEKTSHDYVKAAAKEYLDTKDCGVANRKATDALIAAFEKCGCDCGKEVLKYKDYLAKKSIWIFGGDGWAYD
ncbi:MAG: 4Fe-4S dicluster domain-containing protein, partial [Oscillospiraceae bacterium]